MNKRWKIFLIGPVFSKTFTETLESSNKALCSAQQFIETCHTTNLLCYIYRYTSIEIKPELQKNILKFGYGINYKYEGMDAHLFDRFCVVTKWII